MSLFDWFAKRPKAAPLSQEYQQREIADGLWTKCLACGALTYTKDLHLNYKVCPECGYHHPVTSQERIKQLVDADTWQPLNEHLTPADPLHFVDRKPYSERLREMQHKTGLKDAIQTGLGQIEGWPVALGVMDFNFMGGSMGSVVGEKIARLVETATQSRLPVILVCASGGARMQEGMLSLMQMAKTAAALGRHRQANLLYISVLTHPTTGGVTASFAMLGDLILAEPKALIGFAGRRVIEQTLREKLPDDFQTAEYLLQHGFVDMIVPRTRLKPVLGQLLRLHSPVQQTGGHRYVTPGFLLS
ncbi:MAG: acetyl-CoA carboxylase, carboxyltransferase subunit beta [Gloeomargarita sp. SKYBB_i_bin120]|nr:acetyl-CoA carboxylase, carboxyltransferase subunit beta [Gloeomargarita sp. SKYG98]MCS7293469.1 acetyl-CoA carboxylase, carboxyltransferase subunit beta [Gloeomargarita sp. SKYB120]MDW8179035.1 acetyl-CoA carboxylase, carboxyltransferase subunit beta [Gloeomargarita sp. SKYBB_i_bin120]